MLKQHNSAILEWLILSGYEERALKFWEELGCPPGIDGDELRKHTAVKESIRRNDYRNASELIDNIENGEISDNRTHASFRLAFAGLVIMINQQTDPMQVIAHAREVVVPLIAQLPSPELRALYTNLLNSFMALLVLPENAAPPETYELRAETQLQDWVLESIQACFQNSTEGEAKLDRIVNCYRVIAEETIS